MGTRRAIAAREWPIFPDGNGSVTSGTQNPGRFSFSVLAMQEFSDEELAEVF